MSDARDGEPDPFLENAEDDNGVDRSLIRWMLSLTPRERLRVLAAEAAFGVNARVLDEPDSE